MIKRPKRKLPKRIEALLAEIAPYLNEDSDILYQLRREIYLMDKTLDYHAECVMECYEYDQCQPHMKTMFKKIDILNIKHRH